MALCLILFPTCILFDGVNLLQRTQSFLRPMGLLSITAASPLLTLFGTILGQKDIVKYIELFYNRKCRHASLGYVSPVVYEEKHEMKQGRVA